MSFYTAIFRFYEELNDFLPAEKRKVAYEVPFEGNPSVKDTIEAQGVPHPEVDLIIVNGTSVDFSYHLKDNDRVAVYPEFEGLDIADLTRLRPKPLREPRFICDVHLGGLARHLRMLGFDTLYRNDYDDHQIVGVACEQKRIILTRDRGLLKHRAVERGYCLRSTNTTQQVAEVLKRFDLKPDIEPFARCMKCNGLLCEVAKEDVIQELEPQTKKYHDRFFRCLNCGRIYWEGSHVTKMKRKIRTMIS